MKRSLWKANRILNGLEQPFASRFHLVTYDKGVAGRQRATENSEFLALQWRGAGELQVGHSGIRYEAAHNEMALETGRRNLRSAPR